MLAVWGAASDDNASATAQRKSAIFLLNYISIIADLILTLGQRTAPVICPLELMVYRTGGAHDACPERSR
jgi:hypothetical protein